MAVLVSDDYMDLIADEGQKISLEFTVDDQSAPGQIFFINIHTNDEDQDNEKENDKRLSLP